MLYDMEGFRKPLERDYTEGDITMVVAVRLHAANPWVLERLYALAGYYAPAPRILIVDFGSAPEYEAHIREACAASGFALLRVNDAGVFSLASARNQGAKHAESELIFFSDIDCFGERDLFSRLVRFANTMELGARFDYAINLPVYHLGQSATDAFFAGKSAEERSRSVGHSLAHSVLSARGAFADYVDPHSNFFLIRRDFFDFIGGINESFRGHGSEDFEFLLRLSLYSLQYPVPVYTLEDGVSPRQKEFYGPRSYYGFRRMFELSAEPAQLAGLRIAHLHHDRGKDNSGWYENSDWSRTRFLEQALPFSRSRIALLEYDFLPRDKKALVLIRQETHADVFFPLRLAGYRLIVARPDDAKSLERGRKLIESGEVDAVAVFNPYMKSHADLLPLFESARQKGLKTIVFERGALPESWYYGPDMSYADPDFQALELREDVFSADELALVDAYAKKLRAGEATLEANGTFEETFARLSPLREKHSKICVIPLQLHDDVAVTRFNEGFAAYPELPSSIERVALAHPDVLFLVKAHPLSKVPFTSSAPNVLVCDEQSHIHAMIEVADSVVCYNSGVGLLALIHEKKLVTLGNAYYNLEGLGQRARSLEDAVTLLYGDAPALFHTRPVRALLAFLLLRKYSFFRSETVMRESANRKAHNYKNMLFYQLNFEGTLRAKRAALDLKVPTHCYATARMGIGTELEQRGYDAYDWLNLLTDEERKAAPKPRKANKGAKLEKLLRDPKRFFEDSRHVPLRAIAPVMPEGDSPSLKQLQKLIDDPAMFLARSKSPALKRLGKKLVRKRYVR